MSQFQHVAVAGATGLLGRPIIQALLDANFSVTALTRGNSSTTLPSSVKVVQVDYDSVPSLTAALQGQDVLVSTLASAALGSQEKLFEAAIQAGVQRLIPSEFGCDLNNPKTRQLPFYSKKVAIQELLKSKTQGTKSTYTFIYNNAFLDGLFDLGFTIKLKEKKMEIFNGGEGVYTATPLPLVAKGVIGVLKHPEETANRDVRLHGVAMTQRELLDVAQQVVGRDGWELTASDTIELERESQENFKRDPGNFASWGLSMLKVAAFDRRYGCDFSQNNDNRLLGLTELSEKEVEDVVRSRT